MFRSLFAREDYEARGEAMRRVHSAWLTRMLRRGNRAARIPTRLVDQDGYAPLMATVEGRAWAAEFWEKVLGEDDAG